MRRSGLIYLILALTALPGGCEKEPAEALTTLHSAAVRKDVETVRSLLFSGANPNARDSTGKTPLHGSARAGSLDVISLLIAHGAKVNAQDRWGRTPLHSALEWRHNETVELLIRRGADVTRASHVGETPLHLAAEHGLTEITPLLLARGADVDARTRGGNTPLWRAAESRHLKIVELLADEGANVNTPGAPESSTPLHLAAAHGDEGMVRFLLDAGAQIDPVDNRNRTPALRAMQGNHKWVAEALVAGGANVTIHLAAYLGDVARVQDLIESGTPVDQPDTEGQTALYYAAQQGQTGVAQALLDTGAEVNVLDDGDPLWAAARHGRYEMVELLLTSGADVRARRRGGCELVQYAEGRGHHQVARLLIDEGAYVGLDLAAAVGHLAEVKQIIAEGANLNAPADRWRIVPPLHRAVEAGHADVVSVLLANGADIEVRDQLDRTPLHEAAFRGDTDMAKLLIAQGANVNATARYERFAGQSPLHLAAYVGHPSMIALLLEKGADINAPDEYGRTPLHLATFCGHASVVSVLLKNGADPNATDSRQHIPLVLAQSAGFADIVALLAGDAAGRTFEEQGPYAEIITDVEHVQAYLRCYGIHHETIWIPDSNDIAPLNEVLAARLRDGSGAFWKLNVQANLRRYNREYAGFTVDGHRYILCAMNLLYDEDDNVPDNRFADIGDGWWTVVRVIFDAEKRTVIRLECNGEA